MSKGNFNDKISAEFTPPKTWELERVLSLRNGDMYVIFYNLAY